MADPPAAPVLPLQVLFVDDEPRVLQGLERMLRPMRHEWSMRFADGGATALAELEREPADVVISDMRMPGMTGGQLLGEIMRRWPATIRIILSGQADLELVHRTIGPAHQFLQKPCEADTLKAIVQRICRLRAALPSAPLRLLVGGMQTVPSLATIYDQLPALLQEPEVSMRRVGTLVASDLGMSARMLQLVNSAFFGIRRSVSDPVEAAELLGADTIRALVASEQAFVRLEPVRQTWFDPMRLWDHSARVSRLARAIAGSLSLPADQIEAAAVAGLLHDTGHLLLAAYRPREFAMLARRVRDEGDFHCERLALGSTHGEVTAYLLGLWGFPDATIEAVAWHHEPWRSPGSIPGPVSCVHIADAMINHLDGTPAQNLLSGAHLAGLGLSAEPGAWLELAKQAG